MYRQDLSDLCVWHWRSEGNKETNLVKSNKASCTDDDGFFWVCVNCKSNRGYGGNRGRKSENYGDRGAKSVHYGSRPKRPVRGFKEPGEGGLKQSGSWEHDANLQILPLYLRNLKI